MLHVKFGIAMKRAFHAALATYLLLLAASTAPALQIRTVVLEGQHAPGTPAGAIFEDFDTPTLNSAGLVAFRGRLKLGLGGVVDKAQLGVWSEGSGTLELVARASDQAPGVPAGGLFNTPQEIVFLSDTGRAAFISTLRTVGGGVDGSNNYGIWAHENGALSLVARMGDQAPGVPTGARFQYIGTQVQPSDPRAFRSSKSGILAFEGGIQDTNDEAGVTSANNGGIWSYDSQGGQLLVREGEQAPGTPDGVLFLRLNIPPVNDLGRVAFSANLSWGVAGVTSANDSGIWTNSRGTLKLVAREGDQAPGMNPGETFDVFFSTPGMNDNGDVAFSANLKGDSPYLGFARTGIWSTDSGSLSLVAGAGMDAPDVPHGVQFQLLQNVVINSGGKSAFLAYLTGPAGEEVPPSIGDHGIWSNVSGELKLVARRGVLFPLEGFPPELLEGSIVPGAPEGTSFEHFFGVALNDAGQVAFSASTRSPGMSQSRGIWAQDQMGTLQLVVQDGSQIDVDNGPGVDLRTVHALEFLSGTGNEDGRPSGFNDLGQIAFRARFTDDTSGVFVSNVVADLPPIPGDFDLDGDVDGRDLLAWQRGASPNLGSDSDLADWQRNYGRGSLIALNIAVPEPTATTLLLVLVVIAARRSR